MIVTATSLTETAFALASDMHSLVTDQAPDYGGEGRGPMPSELLLWSVAACFGQAIRYVAMRRRRALAGLTLEVEGTKDAQAFRFGEIAITVRAAVPRPLLEAIVQQASRYCFVTNSLAVPVRCVVISKQEPSEPPLETA